MTGFLAAALVDAIVLILGRLRSCYLDENERIAKGLRRFDGLIRSSGLILVQIIVSLTGRRGWLAGR
jgi:hypothetical protein